MNVIYRVCKSYQDMTCRERGVPVPEEQCLMIAGTSIPRAPGSDRLK
jgi:hypothetical protein